MSIFKAYDIRGIYPKELDEGLARKIGQALVMLLKPASMAVGRDMRSCAVSIQAAFTKGVTEMGCHVIDIGQVSTPMISFAVGYEKHAAGVMITASHNPKEYIGFKICKKDAVPIGYDNGLAELECLVKEEIPLGTSCGQISTHEILEDYVCYLHKQVDVQKICPFKVVIDAGNGMGGVVSTAVFRDLACDIIPMYFEPDGNFPNHEPNPLKKENMVDLQKAVREYQADFGMAFDGDADRVMFVDEKGDTISSDMITILIGRALLKQYPGGRILYDLRSSRSVKEALEAAGATTSMCRVGHAFIKRQLREENGLFAGELSGHFYFRDNFYADSGMLAALWTMMALSESERPMSHMIAPFKKYFASGEINSKVNDADAKMRTLEHTYSDGCISHLDGLTVVYNDWWFNVRKSNTEPVLRLNLEADDLTFGRNQLDKILTLIRTGSC